MSAAELRSSAWTPAAVAAAAPRASAVPIAILLILFSFLANMVLSVGMCGRLSRGGNGIVIIWDIYPKWENKPKYLTER
jgi:hypothetical protein